MVISIINHTEKWGKNIQAAAYNGAWTVFCAGPNVHVVHNSTNRDSSSQKLYTMTVE